MQAPAPRLTGEMSAAEKRLINGFRSISSNGRRHVLRVLAALERGLNPEDVEFSLWFDRLARRKGLDRLTYKDVLRDVRRVRHDA